METARQTKKTSRTRTLATKQDLASLEARLKKEIELRIRQAQQAAVQEEPKTANDRELVYEPIPAHDERLYVKEAAEPESMKIDSIEIA